jgi:4-hydroxy-tetrahydrodipicolinate synthase
MKKTELIGVWPELVTPFDKSLNIDYGTLNELIDFYIEAGVTGIHLNARIGEVEKLTPAEQISLVRKVAGLASGKTIIASTGNFMGKKLTDQVDFAREIEASGADIVLFTVPQFCGDGTGQEDLEKYFLMMAEMLDGKLGVYEYPRIDVLRPDEKLIETLSKTGRFHAYKESGGGLRRVEKISDIARDSAMVPVLTGIEELFELEPADAGYSGPLAAWAPELIKKYFYTPDSGESKENFISLFGGEKINGNSVSSQTVKKMLAKRGLKIESHTRERKSGKNEKNVYNLIFEKYFG